MFAPIQYHDDEFQIIKLISILEKDNPSKYKMLFLNHFIYKYWQIMETYLTLCKKVTPSW